MTSAHPSRGASAPMPVNGWYAVAPAASVGPGPLPLRAVGRPVPCTWNGLPPGRARPRLAAGSSS